MVYFHGHIGDKIAFGVSRLFLIPILQYVANVTSLLQYSRFLLPGRVKEHRRGLCSSDPFGVIWFFYLREDVRNLVELNRPLELVFKILPGVLPWLHKKIVFGVSRLSHAGVYWTFRVIWTFTSGKI